MLTCICFSFNLLQEEPGGLHKALSTMLCVLSKWSISESRWVATQNGARKLEVSEDLVPSIDVPKGENCYHFREPVAVLGSVLNMWDW